MAQVCREYRARTRGLGRGKDIGTWAVQQLLLPPFSCWYKQTFVALFTLFVFHCFIVFFTWAFQQLLLPPFSCWCKQTIMALSSFSPRMFDRFSISLKSDFPHLLVTHPAPSKLLSLGPIFTSIFEISLTWPNSVYCVSCFRFLCVWLICIHVCVFASFTSLCGQHLVSAVLLVSQNHPKQKVIMRSRSLLMWSPHFWRLFFWGRTLNSVKLILQQLKVSFYLNFLVNFR